MKKLILSVLGGFLLMWAGSSFALPLLQLDISKGVYNTATESVFSTSEQFTLYALADSKSKDFSKTATYYVAASIVSKSGQSVPSGNLGSFSFAGKTVNVTSDMIKGTPNGLSPHGIFETYYKEFAFKLDTSKRAKAYNVQDNPGALKKSSTGQLYYYDFAVDISKLNPAYDVHFDLYTKNADGSVNKFAPFSHDAQGIKDGYVPPVVPVPEPTMILLVGIGLLGLAGLRKAKKS